MPTIPSCSGSKLKSENMIENQPKRDEDRDVIEGEKRLKGGEISYKDV